MKRSLILGGTKGLGKALAEESVARGTGAIVTGRTAVTSADWSEDIVYLQSDLSDPECVNDLTELFKVRSDGSRNEITHVFWVAGHGQRAPFRKMDTEDILSLIETHVTGPTVALNWIARFQAVQYLMSDKPGQPWHLVTISSTSSYRARNDEEVYCGVKAYKSHFTRNFARGHQALSPNNRTTLVNPGGMASEFWDGTGQDMEKFMDTALVAKIIWDHVAIQKKPYDELNIPRDSDGTPLPSLGQKTPEAPF